MLDDPSSLCKLSKIVWLIQNKNTHIGYFTSRQVTVYMPPKSKMGHLEGEKAKFILQTDREKAISFRPSFVFPWMPAPSARNDPKSNQCLLHAAVRIRRR